MFNFGSQGSGQGGFDEQVIMEAISKMMGRSREKKNGRSFDNGPYRRASRLVEAQHDTTLWDYDDMADAVLKVDSGVMGCCGDPTCRMDMAIRAARKRLGLWTTEEAINEAFALHTPEIVEAVAQKLQNELPDMMEEAALKAIKADRRSRWYNRATRAVIGAFVEFFATAFFWRAIGEAIDKQLEPNAQMIEAAGFTVAKAKRAMIRKVGLAAMLGYYAGAIVTVAFTIAIYAALAWVVWNYFWFLLGTTAVYGLWLLRKKHNRVIAAVTISEWWENYISDTIWEFRYMFSNFADFDDDDLPHMTWDQKAGYRLGCWYGTNEGRFARFLRWAHNSWSNRRFHPIAWVRTHWPRKSNNEA